MNVLRFPKIYFRKRRLMRQKKVQTLTVALYLASVNRAIVGSKSGLVGFVQTAQQSTA